MKAAHCATLSALSGSFGCAGNIVWATEVQCTGLEERLDQCFFPEEFGDARPDYSGDSGPGIRGAECAERDGRTLAVVCRQFEIEGKRLIL